MSLMAIENMKMYDLQIVLGPVQTSYFSLAELNSNLDRPN